MLQAESRWDGKLTEGSCEEAVRIGRSDRGRFKNMSASFVYRSAHRDQRCRLRKENDGAIVRMD